eukprot:CAMPEP_0116005368 /NCGR_PEP_ID=MMETSP0321-20121206/1129_1 /TAXON_ID=163516 /ORGANISM="Leptocylindrus danicus var. danicus, Strain B650" /LENGTH=499 /DNA_ID=CAMNT_0003473793 /DNA_START=229 /DNA_END=1728 /DNA_ORIENTATION=+
MRKHHPLVATLCATAVTAVGAFQHTSNVPIRTAAATTFLKSSPYDGSDESDGTSQLSRRQFGELSVATIGLLGSFIATRENQPTDYGLYGVLPVGPYKRKKTIMDTIIPDQVWTFDQKFGILNVQVPVRMTVVKLSSGGLFVYNPIAATPECLEMVQELVDKYGPVKHVVLGTVAIEHKVYAGVFAQKFPSAKVWLQPGQYSFPTNLPDTFLGYPAGRTFPMPKTIEEAPSDWKQDFEFETLGPLISKDGAFGETVFYHKPTKSLLVTDTVLEVTDELPRIFEDDPKPLIYHARDTITDDRPDSPELRARGWRRVVLFGLFFTPSAIVIKDTNTALAERRPDINSDFAGIYPWDWIDNGDVPSFNALKGGLLVAPILQQLILNRNPIEALDFADKVAKWDFVRILPAHLKNNLQYDGKAYRKAFSFLEATGVPAGLPKPLAADMKGLVDAEVNLIESGAIATAPPLPGGSASRAEIIAESAYRCRAGVCVPKAPIVPPS